uniref:Ovule protein n=1 Tax=Haemonchus placei TaxID=6290 RepID=A0A0N4XAV3_HAEPC
LADVDKEKVPDNTEPHAEVKTEEANDESLGKSRSSIRDRAFNSVISFCRGKRAIHSEDQGWYFSLLNSNVRKSMLITGLERKESEQTDGQKRQIFL